MLRRAFKIGNDITVLPDQEIKLNGKILDCYDVRKDFEEYRTSIAFVRVPHRSTRAKIIEVIQARLKEEEDQAA